MILWSTPKWVLVIGHYDNKFYIVIFKTAIKMAIIRTVHTDLSEYINSGLELKTFLSPMECLLSKMLPALGGPVLFMAPYRSQEVPKNEFWWSPKTHQVENGTLLQWPLITRYPIIWGPGQSRGNWGA